MSATGARDQVNRLLALVPYLQSRGELSVADAAREFGVTERTIRRDINVLMFCGLPGLGMGDLIEIDFEAFEGEDVIRLSNADYLNRPLRLDSTEAAALVVGLRTLLEGSTGAERDVVERTLHKVEAAAGEAAGVAAQLDVRVPTDPRELAVRDQLSRAVADKRQVRLSHQSPVRDEVTTRVVDPIAISGHGGHVYLDAWDHSVDERRLFRLDRVIDVAVLETGVTTHTDLPPRDLSDGAFQASPDALLATVRLSAPARWVTEYYPVESIREEPDGGATVTLRVAEPAWLVRLMLRLGGSATLTDPADLADQVRTAAARALDQYR